MRKACMLLLVLVAVVVLAQEKSSIVVKDTSITTGVVIVAAEAGGRSIELQCNQNTPACTPLKSGKFLMVELPKNHGMYDCRNVEVYQESANLDTAQKIGAYCLIQK